MKTTEEEENRWNWRWKNHLREKIQKIPKVCRWTANEWYSVFNEILNGQRKSLPIHICGQQNNLTGVTEYPPLLLKLTYFAQMIQSELQLSIFLTDFLFSWILPYKKVWHTSHLLSCLWKEFLCGLLISHRFIFLLRLT